MKKFYEVDEIFKDMEEREKLTRIDEEYKKIMSEIPNFNKHKDNSVVIYRRKNFIIIKNHRKSYIIINRNKGFKNGHTHTYDFKYSKSLIDLAIRKKLPRKANRKIIISLLRISDDEKYLKALQDFMPKK